MVFAGIPNAGAQPLTGNRHPGTSGFVFFEDPASVPGWVYRHTGFATEFDVEYQGAFASGGEQVALFFYIYPVDVPFSFRSECGVFQSYPIDLHRFLQIDLQAIADGGSRALEFNPIFSVECACVEVGFDGQFIMQYVPPGSVRADGTAQGILSGVGAFPLLCVGLSEGEKKQEESK